MSKQRPFVLFLLLFLFSATCDLIAASAGNKPVLLPKYKEIFKSYGIDLVIENYVTSDQGKILTQDDLNADIEHIIQQFQLMGRKYVEMSKCRKIVIRGSHPKVAFASGSSLHFKYRTTGAIRHELFHAYDPFIFAYRYWKSLNHEKFYYIYGGRKGIPGDLSNREILCCFSNMSQHADGFTWSYAQSNHREDVASIFNHTTDPNAAAKWLKRSRESKIFQKKFFTIIANCAEATGYEYWRKLYNFTDQEWQAVRNSYVDVAKEKNIIIKYDKNNFRRYGKQRRTAMALMALDNRMIKASGITRIQFSSGRRVFQLRGDTLTVNDEDFPKLIEGIFLACYRRNSQMVKKYLNKKGNENVWAVLFRRCVLNIRDIARKSSTDTALYQDILCLKKFTESWLPDKFWSEIFSLRDDLIADREYEQQFQRYKIAFNVSLPTGVTGDVCSQWEIDNAKRIFVACSSVLDEKFISGSGVKRIAFAKNMKNGNRRVIGGVFRNGVLCLDPTYRHLGRTVFYELFLRFDNNIAPDLTEWKSIVCNSQDYVSPLAKNSLANDRAETFAWLLWNSFYTCQRANKSKALKKKINLILGMDILSVSAYAVFDLTQQPE